MRRWVYLYLFQPHPHLRLQGHVGLVIIVFFNRICADFIHTISIPHEFYVEDLIGDDHGDKLAQTIFYRDELSDFARKQTFTLKKNIFQTNLYLRKELSTYVWIY